MKKNTDTNKDHASEVRVSNDLDDESIEVIKIADRKEGDTSGDPSEMYRIWNCNGVTVGVHLHKNKP